MQLSEKCAEVVFFWSLKLRNEYCLMPVKTELSKPLVSLEIVKP